jgi:predicted secreted protein
VQIGSIIAIYFLFWVAVAFLMLPFGVKTDEEMGTPKVPGQADSAPYKFDLKRHLAKAAVIALVLTAIYVVNYLNGWITAEDLDLFN